jgi:GGDEF domain-containing protein
LPEVLVQLDPALRAEVCEELSAQGVGWTLEPLAGRFGPSAVLAAAPAASGELAALIAHLRGRWRIPPLLFLLSTGATDRLAQALGAGADEWLPWPERRAELVPRLQAALRRRAADLGRHPLTGLPGAPALLAALQEAAAGGPPVAAVALDLRRFKAFNDRYGFARADCVLSFVANLLEVVAKNEANVYHVGGDDFCLLCAPALVHKLATAAVEMFTAGVASYYDEGDRRAGGFMAAAREDARNCWYPIMSLTTACVVVGPDSGAEEVGRLLATLRVEAKLHGPTT